MPEDSPDLYTYSREDVRQFVEQALELRGAAVTGDPELYREALVGTIRLLPPDAQMMVMTGGDQFHLTAADFEEVQNAWKERGGNASIQVGGFQSSRDGALVYAADTPGDDNVYRHEHGHAMDNSLRDSNGLRFSDGERWREAVAKEMANRKLDPERSTFAHSVLPESRTLSQHLSHYTPEQASSEAFAEMTNHYYSSYANNLGDMEKVNADLSKAYPDLWPVYRDEALPKMHALAEKVQAEAFHAVDENVKVKEELAKAAGEPFDPETERAKMRSQLVTRKNGLATLVEENTNLLKVIERLDRIEEVVKKEQQIAGLSGQEFDYTAAFNAKIAQVREQNLSSHDLRKQLSALDAEIAPLQEKGADVVKLEGMAEGLQVRRDETGYRIAIPGSIKDQMQTVEAFEQQMAAAGMPVNADNYVNGPNGLEYHLPLDDASPETLRARAAATHENLDVRIAARIESAEEAAHAAAAAGRAAQETHGVLGWLRKVPGIGPVLAAAVTPVVVLAAGGSGAQAAEAAVPGLDATRENRPTEAVLQGSAGLIDGATVVVEIAGATAAAPGLALAATVVTAANEVGRPLLRLAGVNVDPSLSEQGVTAVYNGVLEANKAQIARLESEMPAGELKVALSDPQSKIHEVFENNFKVEYEAKMAALKAANDGELPASLPATLKNPQAYADARMQDTIAPLIATDERAPAGVDKAQIAEAVAGLKTKVTVADVPGHDDGPATNGKSQQVAQAQQKSMLGHA